MRRRLLALAFAASSLLALVLVLVTGPDPTVESQSGRDVVTPVATTAADVVAERLAERIGGTGIGAPTPPSEERIVVREGSIRVVTNDVDRAANALLAFLGEVGGYVERDEGVWGRRTMYVRVPAHSLEDFLSYVSGLGRVMFFKLSVEEVTEQYVDLRARLNASVALERRLLALLERASSIEDVLMVERELRRVRAEIESLQSQLEVLEKRIAYSLVIVELVPSSLSYDVIIRARSSNAEELASRVAKTIMGVGSITSMSEGNSAIIVRGKVQTIGLKEVESLLAPHIVERSVRAVQDGKGLSTITVIVERPPTSRAITWIVEVDDVEGMFRDIMGSAIVRRYVVSFDLAGKEARILLDVPNNSVGEVLAVLPSPSEARESSSQGTLSTVSVIIRESRGPIDELARFMSHVVVRGLMWIGAVLALSLPAGAAAMFAYAVMRIAWKKVKHVYGEKAGRP